MRSSLRTIGRWILFAAAVSALLASLLVFVTAPTGRLWVAAIAIGEWGHFLALMPLTVTALSWRRGRLSVATGVIALVAGVALLSPVIRAVRIGRSLPERCTTSFGASKADQGRSAPLALFDLLRGINTSGVEVTEHVYAQNGRKPLKLDLYRAQDSTEPQPIVLMVHGGSWKAGNKAQLPAINRYLAREGYAVAAIDYRHAPKNKFPAPVEDVFRAIAFLRANAAELHLDPSRIALIGRSAGGQIALSAAYSGRDAAIRGVVSFYAPSDLVLGYENPSRRGVLDSRQVLEDYLGGPPAQNAERYLAASAVNFVTPATPPTLLIHGSLDPIVWPMQSERLASRLAAANRPHLYLPLPWATHGCDANISGPSGQLSLYAIDRFLASAFAQ